MSALSRPRLVPTAAPALLTAPLVSPGAPACWSGRPGSRQADPDARHDPQPQAAAPAQVVPLGGEGVPAAARPDPPAARTVAQPGTPAQRGNSKQSVQIQPGGCRTVSTDTPGKFRTVSTDTAGEFTE